MPSPQAMPPPSVPSAPLSDAAAAELAQRLGGLREEIDEVDEALHDLLMRRARVVGQVAALTQIGKVPFRPGREAAVIRRLLARHDSRLPARAVVRLWREIFAASLAMEARVLIAACEPAPGDQMVQLTREHFGALTPLRVSGSPSQAIAEVSGGQAIAAVLPMPAQDEPASAAWWTGLMHRDAPRIHVVARLPFWGSPRGEGAVGTQALVVTAAAADPSGDDRSLVGFELPPEGSRTRLNTILADAGLAASTLLMRRDPGGSGGVALIDVAGFLADDDERLRRLSGAVVLGRYAVPVEGSDG